MRDGEVLANPRETFITPPGEGEQLSGLYLEFLLVGFRPSETAQHHRQQIVGLVIKALYEANIHVLFTFGLQAHITEYFI